MALGFYLTNAVVIGMMGGATGNGGTTFGDALDAGTAAVFNIYDGSVPADADASIGASNLLAQLVCTAAALTTVVDDTPGALATFDTITADSSADNTGTATYFRLLTQSGGTTIAQGTVGTGTNDLVLNTAAITSGSNVSITAATILFPEGP
jgi:hypothetical protein